MQVRAFERYIPMMIISNSKVTKVYIFMELPEGATECATGVIAAAVENVDEDASGADAWLDDKGTDLAEL